MLNGKGSHKNNSIRDDLTRLLFRLYEQIVVETDNYRDAAFVLDESVGFRGVRAILVYCKDYTNVLGKITEL